MSGGLAPVPPGHVAAIVTSLEMNKPPALAVTRHAELRFEHLSKPTPQEYRALFGDVGGHWLWYSRLKMDDAALSAAIHRVPVAIFAAVDPAGGRVGMVELEFDQSSECRIAFFGLLPQLVGKGVGRWLMAETLRQAWRPGVRRVWVHTCSLDHPSALGFYRAQGFVAFARAMETFRDPRLTGVLPRDAAPQIPLIDS